jgi:long-chain acyl-CoA synthetase
MLNDTVRELNLGRVLETAGTPGNAMLFNRQEETALIDLSRDDETVVSWGSLLANTNRTANALLDSGLESGNTISLVMNNSEEFYYLWLGAATAGIRLAPLNTGLTIEDFADQIDRSDAKHVFADDTLLDRVKLALDRLEADIPLTVVPIESEDEYAKFEEFYANYPADDPLVPVGDRDIQQILFTSGTTSKPKGVEISHINAVMGYLNYALDIPGLGEDSRMLITQPLFHNAGQLLSFGPWVKRGSVVTLRSFDIETIAQTIEEYGITHMNMESSMLRRLLDLTYEYDLTSLESVTYAISPLPMTYRRQIIEELDADPSLISGQTECYPLTYVFPPEHQLEKEGNIWGHTSPLTKQALVDKDDEFIEEPYERGELITMGPNVTEGYLDSSKEEGKYIDGWWRWGDVGYFDEDGYFYFEDRKKDMIKTAGENVASVRVEEELLDHDAVINAAVVGLPHERWNEAVTGFVETTIDVTEVELIEFCKERLADFEAPKAIVFMDEFPRTETEKIRKVELRDAYADLYEE